MEDWIYGEMNGYSQQAYLHALDNNRGSTVLQYFIAAAQIHGRPSRLRSEYGGESVEVARAMLLCQDTVEMSRSYH